MKERPILFSGEMVRAILNGTKTQTRRVVKPQPKDAFPMRNVDGSLRGDFFLSDPDFGNVGRSGCFCPYGTPGDRLWVRETWSEDALRMYPCPRVWYRATDSIDRNDGHTCPEGRRGKWADCVACWEESVGRKFQWKPSIFMKRHHSRITLQIVSVWVERLGEINGVDAWREGCPYHPKAEPTPDDVKSWYRDLWEKINGAGSWAVNPWVWVVEFKRVEGGR